MLKSLNVTGFRNLSSLSMEGLTRVNLLVGENNAGKTSVLEAIEILLLARTEPVVLTKGPRRRGEYMPPSRGEDNDETYLDLGQLFRGGQTSVGATFTLEGELVPGPISTSCSIASVGAIPAPHGLSSGMSTIEVTVTSQPGSRRFSLPLELSESRRPPQLAFMSPPSENDAFDTSAVYFIGTRPVPPQVLGWMWDTVMLTPEEPKAIEALQIIQPDIERLAWLSSSGRGPVGMFVKLRQSDRRFPLGSMGEGISRLLFLILNLVESEGGYLLIDEIDTGLHYSVMVKMWKLVVETARRLNVQVFATSHSLDCIQALAGLYESEPDVRNDISLHRIEKGAAASIRYSADEILSAARHQVEVR
ncbi:AAA family ATPase [Archangium primigenium]|uniref:AAA family ATPase n=1 Tax=[Archangium] primigenium TaxID=2792470 RepID=UPI00195685FB|nr:AAA family ATPase [Archangium primigenium]MBM7116562.1 AAA family ATPase [Archangium primigenium]